MAGRLKQPVKAVVPAQETDEVESTIGVRDAAPENVPEEPQATQSALP